MLRPTIMAATLLVIALPTVRAQTSARVRPGDDFFAATPTATGLLPAKSRPA